MPVSWSGEGEADYTKYDDQRFVSPCWNNTYPLAWLVKYTSSQIDSIS